MPDLLKQNVLFLSKLIHNSAQTKWRRRCVGTSPQWHSPPSFRHLYFTSFSDSIRPPLHPQRSHQKPPETQIFRALAQRDPAQVSAG